MLSKGAEKQRHYSILLRGKMQFYLNWFEMETTIH
jgi:hypothetical protein